MALPMTGPKVDGADQLDVAAQAAVSTISRRASAPRVPGRCAGVPAQPSSPGLLLARRIEPALDTFRPAYWRARSSFLTFLASFFSFTVLAGSFLDSFLLS